MTPACIFTYGGDSLLVRECVRSCLLAGIIPVVCDDAAAPLPGNVRGWLWEVGADYLQTAFPRRGNLNGTDCTKGIVRTMREACERHGAAMCLKLDVDSVIVDPVPFLVASSVGCFSSEWERRMAFGCCYSLTREACGAILERMEAEPDDPSVSEDLHIWQTLQALGLPNEMHDFDPDHGLFAGAPLSLDPASAGRRFACLTFGNRPPGGWSDRNREISSAMRRMVDHLTAA